MRFYVEGLLAFGLAVIAITAYTSGIHDVILFLSLPLSLGIIVSINLRIKKVWAAILTVLIAITTSLSIHENLRLIRVNTSYPILFSLCVGLAITALWIFLFSSFRLRPNRPNLTKN
jgi:hypothetical protein